MQDDISALKSDVLAMLKSDIYDAGLIECFISKTNESPIDLVLHLILLDFVEENNVMLKKLCSPQIGGLVMTDAQFYTFLKSQPLCDVLIGICREWLPWSRPVSKATRNKFLYDLDHCESVHNCFQSVKDEIPSPALVVLVAPVLSLYLHHLSLMTNPRMKEFNWKLVYSLLPNRFDLALYDLKTLDAFQQVEKVLNLPMSNWNLSEPGTLGRLAVTRDTPELLHYLVKQAPLDPLAECYGVSVIEHLFAHANNPDTLQTMFETIVSAWPDDCAGMLSNISRHLLIQRPRWVAEKLDEMILCGADEKVLTKSATKRFKK
jgi:hypothetical protein